MKKTTVLILYSLFIFTGITPIPMGYMAPSGPAPLEQMPLLQTIMAESADQPTVYGEGIDISPDGSGMILGHTYGTTPGVVWSYRKIGGVWSYRSNFKWSSAGAGTGDNGKWLSLSEDGSQAVVGYPDYYGGGGGSERGAITFWTRSGDSWSLTTALWSLANAQNYAQTGSFATLSADGEVAVHMSPREGKVIIHRKSGGVWETYPCYLCYHQLIYSSGYYFSLSKNGKYLAVSMEQDSSQRGKVDIYNGTSGTFVLESSILNPNQTVNDFNFGNYLALNEDGTVLLMASKNQNNGTFNCGGGYVFFRSGATWTASPSNPLLRPPPAASACNYAKDRVQISLDGNYLYIPDSPDNHIWKRSGNTYTLKYQPTPLSRQPWGKNFSGPRNNSEFAIGDSFPEPSPYNGKVYIYRP